MYETYWFFGGMVAGIVLSAVVVGAALVWAIHHIERLDSQYGALDN